MKIPYLIALSILLLCWSCKKNRPIDPEPEKPVAVVLPDSVLFVNTVNQPSGATALYVLNAATGAPVTQYTYPADAATTWSYPVAGNNLLYTLQSNKINALDIKTGQILWTDAIQNALTPVLHQQTFLGVRQTGATTYEAYALDATRQSNDVWWKYSLPGAPVQLVYANELVYIKTDDTHLTALDAKTGTAKWSVAASATISLLAVTDGAFIAGNTIYNALTGAVLGTAATVNIPLYYGAGTIVKSQLLYATPTVYYIKTGHYQPNSNSGFDFNKDYLSTVDIATGTEKQRVRFGEGYVLVPITNTIAQSWNNKFIINQSQLYPAKFNGMFVSNAYGMLPASLSAEPVFFTPSIYNQSSDYLIAGSTMYYYHTFYPPTGIIPNVPGSANEFLAVNLLTGQQQWSNDKSFDDFKGRAMTACVYAGGKGYSKYIQ